jgi:pimeloyl-ACP methyl ester carboxylesterase
MKPMSVPSLRGFVVALMLATLAAAWLHASQAGPTPGAVACVALAATGRVPAATTITSTAYVEATAASAPGAGRGPTTSALPAHCIVRGAISPRVGADGKPYETRFELRLPTEWSGRFLYQGGGGNDGNVGQAIGRNTGAFPTPGLARGFAVVSTDAGHQGGGPEFALDRQARIDHAYAAHDRTATTAKTLIARYYGRGPTKSYFNGCSGGGRQGLMFAQRYPGYFDGIIACAPAMSVSSGATIAAAWDTQTFLAVAPADADGRKILSRAFSNEDLALVASKIAASCDAADGASDGMVQRPMQCRFDPMSLVCPREKTPSCVTAAQASALARAFDGPRDSTGGRLYVGQPWDPGIAAPGWRQWKLGTSQTPTPNAANTTLMAGALAYEFLTPPDPSFAITNFNFDRDPTRMEAFSRVYDTFRDATLAAFKARGGRLLLFHGTADGIFSASESVDYFERLAANNGGVASAQTWARLFLIPGMNHCSGGPATDSYDGLQAIVDWVEEGKAPASVRASALSTNPYFPNRTRPLCPYPAFAKYRGTGNIEDASNFVCATE